MACCRAPSIRVPRGGWVGPSESPLFRYDDDDDDDDGDGWVVNAFVILEVLFVELQRVGNSSAEISDLPGRNKPSRAEPI